MTTGINAASRFAIVMGMVVSVTGCKPSETAEKKATPAPVELMSPQALQALPAKPADKRIAYGEDSSQYGDLRIPPGPGPHPVAVLIHGGCFKAAYANVRDLAAMADTLKAEGIATWSIEYRRLGESGGGWPGTYLDISRGVDHLRTIAREYALDLNRVVLVGHSAGGHLAMWAAGRSRVPPASEIHTDNPLRVRGVIDLAGPVDMAAHITEYQTLCRDSVITTLLGGTPEKVSQRYMEASPIKLVPLGVPQVLISGEFEEFVPRPLVEAYATTAGNAGDSVRVIVIPGVGHFEIANPHASPWPAVESAIRSLLNGQLPST